MFAEGFFSDDGGRVVKHLRRKPESTGRPPGHWAGVGRFVGAALFAGAAFWLLDAALGFTLRGGVFADHLLRPDLSDLWTRIYVAALLLVFALYGRVVLYHNLRADRARKISEERFRQLADLLPQTLFEVDLHGNVLYANRCGLRSFGYTEEDLQKGIHVSDLFAKEDVSRVLRNLGGGRVEESGEIGDGHTEFLARRKDDSLFAVSVKSSPVTARGRRVGYRGVMIDVTRLKKVREALRESEEQHRVTINALGDAIFVVNREMEVVLFNAPLRTWNRSLGITKSPLGMKVSDVYPFLPGSVIEEYRRVFDSGETLITEEESVVGGRRVITESRKIPVWEGGVVARVITAIRDITERRKAEEELKRHRDHLEELVRERTEKLGRANRLLREEIERRRKAQRQVLALNGELEKRVRERTRELEKANEELKEVDKMKDIFLSTISHEFRTPLTSIRSYSEVLLTHDEPIHTRREFIEVINSESERLSRLIDNVLDFSQIGAGGVIWNDGFFSIEKVVHLAARAEAKLFEEKELQFIFDPGAPTSPVFADPDRIQQVITNLLGNAIKFSPRGGVITVRTEPFHGRRTGDAAQWVRVSVIDEGPGIAPKDREIIFERFRQISTDTLRNKTKGTGLGLPICRKIVAHYGGSIRVEDAPKGGCVFSFTLPCGGKRVAGDDRTSPGQGSAGDSPEREVFLARETRKLS